MEDKMRLDALMVKNSLVTSRERAKQLISSGQVYYSGKKAVKASESVACDVAIEIIGETLKFVSRGGLKLEKAIELFSIDLNSTTCMDIGASTGGFTDCMLQNGATMVYAVDVGYEQLAQKLREDARVVNLEKTNVRNLNDDIIRDKIDFVSIDVSFISLKLIFPAIKPFLKEGAKVVCLVKPQFEAGRQKIGKNGVVKDKKTHENVCKDIYNFLYSEGLCVCGATFSPIKGPKGNIEYLFYINTEEKTAMDFDNIKEVVKNSHEKL